MKNLSVILFSAILTFVGYKSFGQQLFIPLEKQSLNIYESNLNQKNVVFHTSFKPYIVSSLPASCYEDSLFGWIKTPTDSHKPLRWLYNHLTSVNFINIIDGDFNMSINPYVDFEIGKDFNWDRTIYTNSRGAIVKGDIGNKFSFETYFSENQSLFPKYLTNFVRDSNVVPGIGRAIRFKNDQSYDYASGTGYISYTPSKHFNFQFGQEKVFIGDGYRSLLLSDNSSSYPLLKITTTAGKFQYTNMWAQMIDKRDGAILGEGFRRKYLALHHLSILLGKRIEVGFFEAIVWQAQDSSSYRGFDVSYLNPIIYYHSVQWNLGSPDNSLIGYNFKWKISNTLSFYNQFLLDDFDLAKSKGKKGFYRNKYAYQLGLNYFNAFGLNGFFIQAEYNEVWPYTYAHKIPVINYAHFNQSLADPLGANFREGLLFLQYNHHRWFGGLELMYVLTGIDSTSGDVGQNVYLSEFSIPNSTDVNGKFIGSYGNYVGQGVASNILFAQLKINYLINKKNNLLAEISYTYRNQTIGVKSNTSNFITFGFKTSLFNHYNDF
ncbi:hypothetical protein LBMAG27_23490 [Bacteroidota bacterium]|nr:hypothetical protein LBMAG27_23490 [Bacteroidota bacterium]